MNLGEAIKELTESKEFKDFSQENPDFYLAHAFSMHAPGEEFQWQVGYYLPKRKRLIVFKMNPIEKLPEDEAFNKDGEKGVIKKLELETVTIDEEEAEKKALEFLKKEHPLEEVTKTITILQHLDEQIYNFTLVTAMFNILNIRISASSGKIVSHKLRSILSLKKQ